MITVIKNKNEKTGKIANIAIVDRNRAYTISIVGFFMAVKQARTQNNPAIYDMSNPSSVSWWANKLIHNTPIRITNNTDLMKVGEALQDFMSDYWDDIAVDVVCRF